MKHLFFRCNSGHFFRGLSCPFDGWNYPGIREAEQAFAVDSNIALDRLAELANADEFLKRQMFIVDCASLPPGLEGIRLHCVVVDGEQVESIATI